MIKTLPYKTKQLLVVLLKLSIVVGAFYFVYYKLITNDELEIADFIDILLENELFSIETVLFLLFLSVLNWFFEILKWRNLVSSVIFISLKNTSEQSLGALTASLMTPNRIGDYGAKAMYYPKPLRKKIMLLNLIGTMAQMTTTILFGAIGLLFFVKNYPQELDFTEFLIVVLATLLIVAVIFYSLKKTRIKLKGFSLKKIFKFISTIPVEIHLKTLTLSIARYLIFSFQFYFLLTVFGVQIDYLNAMIIITSMYLISSVIPTIFIFDVLVKGSVAVYLFSIIGVNDLTILSIVTLMWLLNFVIPSVFGSYYVLNFNLPKVRQTT